MTANYQGTPTDTDEPAPGVRLGLPAVGPGSVASYGRRVLGVVIDCAAAYAIAALFTGSPTPRGWSTVAFLAETVILLCVAGQTIGMAATRLYVVSINGGRLHPWWMLIRQVLLLALIPPLITDSDRRGLHDKASGVTVVNR